MIEKRNAFLKDYYYYYYYYYYYLPSIKAEHYAVVFISHPGLSVVN